MRKRHRPPVSFLCERTAEYALVTDFVTLHEGTAARVVPFYFWATREGSAVSAECDRGEKLRLVVAYPRRPKIRKPGQESILVKFSKPIFDSLAYWKKRAVPVLAGVPLVSSILDLRINTPCAWFRLEGVDVEELLVPLDPQRASAEAKQSTSGRIEGEQVLALTTNAPTWTWTEVIQLIRGAPRQSDARALFPHSGYKPLFFVLVT